MKLASFSELVDSVVDVSVGMSICRSVVDLGSVSGVISGIRGTTLGEKLKWWR